MNQSRLSTLVILGLALAIPTTATSATLQVANTETDSDLDRGGVRSEPGASGR